MTAVWVDTSRTFTSVDCLIPWTSFTWPSYRKRCSSTFARAGDIGFTIVSTCYRKAVFTSMLELSKLNKSLILWRSRSRCSACHSHNFVYISDERCVSDSKKFKFVGSAVRKIRRGTTWYRYRRAIISSPHVYLTVGLDLTDICPFAFIPVVAEPRTCGGGSW